MNPIVKKHVKANLVDEGDLIFIDGRVERVDAVAVRPDGAWVFTNDDTCSRFFKRNELVTVVRE